jgi:hypothetical protein
VVVGVVAVRVMKAAADAVVCVTAVRNHFMAAAGAVGIARLRATAAMVRRAAVRGSRVTDGGVAGTRPMLVSMVGMGLRGAGLRAETSFSCPGSADTAVRLSAAWSIALRGIGSRCASTRA